MLNHFSAKLPKIDDWRARAQYMYRDWRPGKSQTCRRLCVRLGDSLHRAESPLHVWGKGHPVQKATPVPQERPNLGTNSLKFGWWDYNWEPIRLNLLGGSPHNYTYIGAKGKDL